MVVFKIELKLSLGYRVVKVVCCYYVRWTQMVTAIKTMIKAKLSLRFIPATESYSKLVQQKYFYMYRYMVTLPAPINAALEKEPLLNNGRTFCQLIANGKFQNLNCLIINQSFGVLSIINK